MQLCAESWFGPQAYIRHINSTQLSHVTQDITLRPIPLTGHEPGTYPLLRRALNRLMRLTFGNTAAEFGHFRGSPSPPPVPSINPAVAAGTLSPPQFPPAEPCSHILRRYWRGRGVIGAVEACWWRNCGDFSSGDLGDSSGVSGTVSRLRCLLGRGLVRIKVTRV